VTCSTHKDFLDFKLLSSHTIYNHIGNTAEVIKELKGKTNVIYEGSTTQHAVQIPYVCRLVQRTGRGLD
jgi:beta-lactamase superfamily II metal-dependent hydrolase